MTLGKMVVNHDGTRYREIETGNETPLRNLDDEFGIIQELRWYSSDLRSEKETRTVRILGFKEIGGVLGELHRHEIPSTLVDMGPKCSDVRRQLDDLGKEIGSSRRLDIPLSIAK